jgi:catechol 2,3-dioxygenase-like lactoylglutathione lyase family enzyme
MAMAFHHVAFATRNLAATHLFYSDVMGFTLVKVVTAPTPEGSGWAKHAFYDTGNGEMIAFWDIHDQALEAGSWTGDPNGPLGLPAWVNHVAFDAPDLEDLAARRQRWQEHARHVMEIDHGFCTSIYTTDPNRILVEFCCTTRAFSPDERREAAQLVAATDPELEAPPSPTFFDPIGQPVS